MMPPEPLTWETKDFAKERIRGRPDSSFGSASRWRGSPTTLSSSHSVPRDLFRFGSGPAKLGGWRMFSKAPGNGYAPSWSSDKVTDDENFRAFPSRGRGKFYRASRGGRGAARKNWRSYCWETNNRFSRPHFNDHRSADEMPTFPSYPRSASVNTRYHGLTKDRREKDNPLGSMSWKPLKWTRSGSSFSRGSGFSPSCSSKSFGDVDSNQMRTELLPKNLSGPWYDMSSSKKPRLGWGEGLAKFEKKIVEEPDLFASNDGSAISSSSTEAIPSLSSNSTSSASPTTPSSVACSSLPGAEDNKSVDKAANVDGDASNLGRSSILGALNHVTEGSFNLETFDNNSISNLDSSLHELIQSDDHDSCFVRSTTLNKLLLWKGDVFKMLQMTESEIDALENELKVLKFESKSGCAGSPSSSSLPVEVSETICTKQEIGCSAVCRTATFQVDSCMDVGMEIPVCNVALEVNDGAKNEDIDSPRTATFKLVEPIFFGKAILLPNIEKPVESLVNMEGVQTVCSIRCPNVEDTHLSSGGDDNMLMKSPNGTPVRCGVYLKADENHTASIILTTNKKLASKASKKFDKLLPKECSYIDVSGVSNVSSCHEYPLIKEKIGRNNKDLRLKERVLTLKFKALKHLWKEDTRLLSMRKYRAKYLRKREFNFHRFHSRYQKHRSSLRSRFFSPAGNLNSIPRKVMKKSMNSMLLDSKVKLYRNSLKMPELILDETVKVQSRFISFNGLVKDPMSVEKERSIVNLWTSEERELFVDKLALFGKDFTKIASFLNHKTTADCVVFYYKNHKSYGPVRTKKKSKKQWKMSHNTYMVAPSKKMNCEKNAASLDILGAASVMAANTDYDAGVHPMSSHRFVLGQCEDLKSSQLDASFMESSDTFDVLQSERETVAADVLAGICGSLSSEAMSSCITSSIDPGDGNRDWSWPKVDSTTKGPSTSDITENFEDDTCSDDSYVEMETENWMDEEKSIFVQAFLSYGKDFDMISQCIRTKSSDQCLLFFSKSNKCLGLDLVQPKSGIMGISVGNDANGGESDMDNSSVLETGSVICNDQIETNMDDNLPVSGINVIQVESNPGRAINLKSCINRLEEDTRMRLIGNKDTVKIMSYGAQKGNKDPVKIMSYGAQKTLDKPELLLENRSNNLGIRNVAYQPELDQAEQNVVNFGDTEAERDEGAEHVSSIDVSLVGACSQYSSIVVDCSSSRYGITTEGHDLSLKGSCLNKRNVKNIDEKSSLKQESYSCRKNSHPTSSFTGFSLNPRTRQQESTELDFVEKRSLESVARGGDQHLHILPHSLVNHVESSQTMKGFSLRVVNKKVIKRVNSSGQLYEAKDISKYDAGIRVPHLAEEEYLRHCSTSKPNNSGADRQYFSQNFDRTTDHLRMHLSDTEKPSKKSNVRLFGQILNASEDKDEEASKSRQSSVSSARKFSCHDMMDGNTGVMKFDHSNHAGLENVPIRGYGFWDGSKILTGFSSLPDSAILLSKYSSAFGNCSISSSNLEQHTPQTVVKSEGGDLNGASVFPCMELFGSKEGE